MVPTLDHAERPLAGLLKCSCQALLPAFLIQGVWGEAQEAASLTRSQVVETLRLLVWEPHLKTTALEYILDLFGVFRKNEIGLYYQHIFCDICFIQ